MEYGITMIQPNEPTITEQPSNKYAHTNYNVSCYNSNASYNSEPVTPLSELALEEL